VTPSGHAKTKTTGAADFGRPEPLSNVIWLLPRRDPEVLGHTDPQVFVRIHGHILDAHFIVQMGTGGAAAHARHQLGREADCGIGPGRLP